jgi:hypothetical protein
MNAARTILLLLLLGAALGAGCYTTTNENDISTIPWNRPESWEGKGSLGSFPRPGGY